MQHGTMPAQHTVPELYCGQACHEMPTCMHAASTQHSSTHGQGVPVQTHPL